MKPKTTTIAGAIFRQDNKGFRFRETMKKKNFNYPDGSLSESGPYLVLPQYYNKEDGYYLPTGEYESEFRVTGFYSSNYCGGVHLFCDFLNANVDATNDDFKTFLYNTTMTNGVFYSRFKPRYTGGNFYVELA